MNTQFYFSIITVSYNSEKTIEKTFISLLNQEYQNFEYIVIDGYSTDQTINIIKKYEIRFLEKGIPFRWISEKDDGIYNAMNKGIKMANGKIIGIINSDDTYTKHALKAVYEESITYPNYDIYHGLMRFWSGNKLTMIRALGDEMLCHSMIEHPTCFVRKELYQNLGLFNEKYQFVADYEFMLRAKKAQSKFYLIESIISDFNENGNGNSFRARKELISLRKKLHLSGNMKLFTQYLKILLRELREKKQ